METRENIYIYTYIHLSHYDATQLAQVAYVICVFQVFFEDSQIKRSCAEENTITFASREFCLLSQLMGSWNLHEPILEWKTGKMAFVVTWQ